MNHKHQRNTTITTPAAKTVAAKAEEDSQARRMEVAFLLTATLVIIVTMGLAVGFHLH